MGNILSLLLSDLYMDEYVKNKLKKVNKKLWRYLDDLLFIITKMNEDEIKLYVEELNSLKETIKFTYVFEVDQRLNYLDITLTRNIEEKRIDVKWFRKDTETDRLLNYESGHHNSIKLNIIKNMATRIINTTKNNKQQELDLNQLKDMLIKSRYPKYLMENSIQVCLKQNNNSNTTITTTNTRSVKNKNDDMEGFET